MKLDGKRVLVTGASSGIGLELSRVLCERGAVLAISSRSSDRLHQVSEELASACPGIKKPLVVSCDVTDETSYSPSDSNSRWAISRNASPPRSARASTVTTTRTAHRSTASGPRPTRPYAHSRGGAKGRRPTPPSRS